MVSISFFSVFVFRRKGHRLLGSDTIRRTHCAVAVEDVPIIFKRRPVLDVVIPQSVCGNVSFNLLKLIILLLNNCVHDVLTWYCFLNNGN